LIFSELAVCKTVLPTRSELGDGQHDVEIQHYDIPAFHKLVLYFLFHLSLKGPLSWAYGAVGLRDATKTLLRL
jgi:hypothetical protein